MSGTAYANRRRNIMARRSAGHGTLRAVVVLLAVSATSLMMMALPAQAEAACFKYRSVEWEFGKLVNQARAARGLNKLAVDTELGRVSRYHSTEMRKRNLLYHTSMGTLGWRITNWRTIGENILWRSGMARVGARAQAKTYFNMFMASKTHRANILRRGYRYQGVGVQYTSTGKAWVTHTFEGTTNPGTRIRAYRC